MVQEQNAGAYATTRRPRVTGAYPGGYASATNTTYRPQPGAVTGRTGQGGTAGGPQNADYPFYTSGRNDVYTNDVNAGALPPGVVPTVPTTTNNGGGGGGGGGGGAAVPDYSAWGGWAAQAQPGMFSHTPLDLPDYNAPAFYDFDPGQFDTARQGVQTGIADARARGDTAFDRSAQSYMNYEDPFAAGPQTSNPGIDPRLLASMEAWGGAGSSQAAQTFGEGVQADDAMGSVYDLLSKVGAQFNQGQLAGVEGDRMQMDQRLGGEERMLTLGVDMALARAKSQYQQDLFAYGKAEADKRYEIAVQEALANNQGTNNANQMNTQTTNNWNQGIMDSILTMIGNGGTGIPQAGNDLSKLITMPRRVA